MEGKYRVTKEKDCFFCPPSPQEERFANKVFSLIVRKKEAFDTSGFFFRMEEHA